MRLLILEREIHYELTGNFGVIENGSCDKMEFDPEKIRYVSILKAENGEQVARATYKELAVDPDLLDGFVTAVVIFAKTPIRSIPRNDFVILIEFGKSILVTMVVDNVFDETPYRKRMKRLLDFVEIFALANMQPLVVRDIINKLHFETPKWVHYHLLQSLISAMEMSWMGFLDGNPIEHLAFIFKKIERPLGLSEITNYIAHNICQQIDDGGSTIGLDIEKAMNHEEYVKRIHSIISKRKNEIAETFVVVDGNSVDLRGVWLTAYGFNILKAFDVGTSCTLEVFNEIQQKLLLNNILINRTGGNSLDCYSTISQGMREYIWEIAELNIDPSSSILSELGERFVRKILDAGL